MAWTHLSLSSPKQGADIKEPNTTTWGGGPLQHKVDGAFNMYVAEMVGSCGITTWQSNSQVVRYTATAPAGTSKDNF